MDAQTLKTGNLAKEPAAPEKEDYTFNGWTNGGTAFDFANTPVRTNISLKANWTANSTGGTTDSGTGNNSGGTGGGSGTGTGSGSGSGSGTGSGSGSGSGTQLPNTDASDARNVFAVMFLLSALSAAGAMVMRWRTH